MWRFKRAISPIAPGASAKTERRNVRQKPRTPRLRLPVSDRERRRLAFPDVNQLWRRSRVSGQRAKSHRHVPCSHHAPSGGNRTRTRRIHPPICLPRQTALAGGPHDREESIASPSGLRNRIRHNHPRRKSRPENRPMTGAPAQAQCHDWSENHQTQCVHESGKDSFSRCRSILNHHFARLVSTPCLIVG